MRVLPVTYRKPTRIIAVEASQGGGGGIASLVAGQNIQIDSTDPANPVVAFGATAPPLIAVLPDGGGPDVAVIALLADPAGHTSVQMVQGGALAITSSDGPLQLTGDIQLFGDQMETPSGAYTIGADDTDLVIDGASHYIKLAGVGILIIGSLGISVQGGAVFNPGHLSTGALPDPADHPGGIIWDTTTLSLAVSNGTAWQHLTAV
jgi:hypothetical protein